MINIMTNTVSDFSGLGIVMEEKEPALRESIRTIHDDEYVKESIHDNISSEAGSEMLLPPLPVEDELNVILPTASASIKSNDRDLKPVSGFTSPFVNTNCESFDVSPDVLKTATDYSEILLNSCLSSTEINSPSLNMENALHVFPSLGSPSNASAKTEIVGGTTSNGNSNISLNFSETNLANYQLQLNQNNTGGQQGNQQTSQSLQNSTLPLKRLKSLKKGIRKLSLSNLSTNLSSSAINSPSSSSGIPITTPTSANTLLSYSTTSTNSSFNYTSSTTSSNTTFSIGNKQVHPIESFSLRRSQDSKSSDSFIGDINTATNSINNSITSNSTTNTGNHNNIMMEKQSSVISTSNTPFNNGMGSSGTTGSFVSTNGGINGSTSSGYTGGLSKRNRSRTLSGAGMVATPNYSSPVITLSENLQNSKKSLMDIEQSYFDPLYTSKSTNRGSISNGPSSKNEYNSSSGSGDDFKDDETNRSISEINKPSELLSYLSFLKDQKKVVVNAFETTRKKLKKSGWCSEHDLNNLQLQQDASLCQLETEISLIKERLDSEFNLSLFNGNYELTSGKLGELKSLVNNDIDKTFSPSLKTLEGRCAYVEED